MGLLGLILIKILAPGFYARQDIRTPVKIALVVLVVTQLSNLVFVPQFQHAGLALSISFGACVNALLLFIGLRLKGVYHPMPGWGLFVMQVLGAILILAAVLLWLSEHVDWLALQAQPFLRIILLGGCLALSAIVYFGTLWLMKFPFATFRRKVR